MVDLKKGIGLFEGIDDRERLIFNAIFQFQLGNHRGMSFGELWELDTIPRNMSRQTFSHRLRDLVDRGLLEKEVVENRRGKPTFYRLNSKLFAELREFNEKYSPDKMKRETQEFEQEIESDETEHYVEALMELAIGRLNTLAIALTFFETEGARRLFYEATYQDIEQMLGCILARASKNREERERTMRKLFELLEPRARRPIGKRFGLDVLYDWKQKMINQRVKLA